MCHFTKRKKKVWFCVCGVQMVTGWSREPFQSVSRHSRSHEDIRVYRAAVILTFMSSFSPYESSLWLKRWCSWMSVCILPMAALTGLVMLLINVAIWMHYFPSPKLPLVVFTLEITIHTVWNMNVVKFCWCTIFSHRTEMRSCSQLINI